MKLIVGLGNPGPEYARTRHNAGFMVIDRLVARWASTEAAKSRFSGLVVECPIKGEKTLLLKPLTYMNRSGQSVVQALAFYKLNAASEMLVLVDDVALPSGAIRLRPSGSAGGHNGLSDIERALGNADYPRLRIGIDAKPPVMALHEYVLGRFTEEQLAAVKQAVEKAADAVEMFVQSGLDAAMNKFNQKDPPPPPPPQQPGARPSPGPGSNPPSN